MCDRTLVKCPTCEKMVAWSKHSKYKPFCSERCQLCDLGQWASEQHRIPCAPQDVAAEHEMGYAAEHEDTPANEPDENLH